MKQKIDINTIKRFSCGDEAAFAEVYAFYKDSLYFSALTLLKNTELASQVVQEAFIKAYHDIHTLKEIEQFHVWLFKIASQLIRMKSYQAEIDQQEKTRT